MSVRFADINDVKQMSYIHARTWKKAYVQYISLEYLKSISDEGWIPLFARAFTEKLHEAAVYETEGVITGTVTFGKGRKAAVCTMGAADPEDREEARTACGAQETLQAKAGCWRKEEEPEGEIISLYVLPQFWSTGQGYALTKFAVERIKKLGFKSCYLWVIRDNSRAVGFYRRFGFESTGELAAVMLAGLPVIEEKYRLRL